MSHVRRHLAALAEAMQSGMLDGRPSRTVRQDRWDVWPRGDRDRVFHLWPQRGTWQEVGTESRGRGILSLLKAAGIVV